MPVATGSDHDCSASARPWQPHTALRAAAQRPLRELATGFDNASIGVSVPDAGRSLLVGGLRGEIDQIHPFQAGERLPVGCAADILTATSTPEAPTPEHYSPKEWKRLLSDVAERGVAFDYRLAPALSCVAAHIRVPSGKPIGAVGAAVFDSKRLISIATVVRRAADMISANLKQTSLSPV